MKTESKLKFCADCKHLHKYTPPTCLKTKFFDIVTGAEAYEDCYRVRDDRFRCGESANWFKAK